MQYWNGPCPLTGIAEPELLRASHIVPWAACESDAERLDVHNGLLLSALWDAAFDKGLTSFADDGTPPASPYLSAQARAALNFGNAPRLAGLRDAHLLRLRRHRLTRGFLASRHRRRALMTCARSNGRLRNFGEELLVCMSGINIRQSDRMVIRMALERLRRLVLGSDDERT